MNPFKANNKEYSQNYSHLFSAVMIVSGLLLLSACDTNLEINVPSDLFANSQSTTVKGTASGSATVSGSSSTSNGTATGAPNSGPIASNPDPGGVDNSPPSPVLPTSPNSGPELDVISVYQSRSDHHGSYHPSGNITVNVSGSGSGVLVLSSYEPTQWMLKLAPGVVLKRVILNGYYAQTAVGVSSNIVELHSYYPGMNALGDAYPIQYPSTDATTLAGLAQNAAHISRVKSFQAAYQQNSFNLILNAAPANRLEVVGIYQPTQNTCRVNPCLPADVLVRVIGNSPTTLFLSSYESTHWIIQAAPGVVTKVVINGYRSSLQSGVAASLVEMHSAELGNWIPYGSFSTSNQNVIDTLSAAATQLTHLPVAGAQARYQAGTAEMVGIFTVILPNS